MCYYRFYIFLGCGHTTTSSTPVRHCANATESVTTTQQENVSQIKSPAIVGTAAKSYGLDLDAGSRPEVVQSFLPKAQHNQSATKTAKSAIKRVKSDSKAPNLNSCGEGRIHSLHTVRVARLCASCADERDERLQAIDLDAIVFKVETQRRQSKGVARHQPLLLDRGTGERKRNSKVDSGVWTVGARWLKDWKG